MTATVPVRSAEADTVPAMVTAGPGAVAIADLDKRFGAHEVLRSVALNVPAGKVVALLGPSGCGKTTLLRAVAGLERPEAGTIDVGGVRVFGPHIDVAPERRKIGMVFQDWALFPHLDVAGNVGYGLPRKERTSQRIEEALRLVGLDGAGRRRPGTLSGGQQQRVALARAVAPRPSVLLLDEPFSNLDTSLRVQVRTELHSLLTQLGITALFVTHDQQEAFVLGDEVAVMSQGTIVQQGRPAEVYSRPATAWVAGFVGDANLLAGEASSRGAVTAVGSVPVEPGTNGPVTVLLRPEDLSLTPGGDAEINLVEYYGHDTVYLVRTVSGVLVRVRTTKAPDLVRGDRVTVRVGVDAATTFPADPGLGSP